MMPTREGGQRITGQGRQRVADLPLISVITVVRNGAATLDRSIRSVVEQDYPNLEHIIIDGGSDDGSIDIIRRWEHLVSYWRSEPDAGIYNAWNKGIDLATGEWIAFLGADDEFKPGAMAAYARCIGRPEHREMDYVSSRVELVSASGRLLRVIGRPWSWPDFQRYMTVAHVGSMHHRRLFEQFGRYDESYRICGDYEFLLRAGKSLRSGFFNEITVAMGADGISSSRTPALREQMRAKVETGKRGLMLSAWEYRLAIAKFVVRNLMQRVTSVLQQGK